MRRLVVLGALWGTPLAAQQSSDFRWTFTDARDGFCVWYLAEPTLARELVPSDVVLAPAGDGAGLPGSVVRVIQDEPHFAAWIPGAICVGRYGQASADDRPPVMAKDGESITVLTHSLAATAPRGASGATHYLIELGTDRTSLARAAELAGARPTDRSVTVRQVPDTDDQEIEIAIGKTKIVWQGHPTGDGRVGWTRTMSFGYAGRRTTSWSVAVAVNPAEARSMVGALRVEGKDDLGKALRASPIRAVGPMERGGEATITFSRAATR